MLNIHIYQRWGVPLLSLSLLGAALISFPQPAWTETLTTIDVFNSISYSGSSGTAPWNGNWKEIGENNGTSGGTVRVVNSNYCAAPNCLRLGGNNVNFSDKGILRAVNLSAASSAVLKFSYRRQAIYNRASGSVQIQASQNGSSWITLGTISFSSRTDPGLLIASYDITSLAAAGSQIRFLGTGTSQRGYMFIDNVEVSFNTQSADGGVDPPPPITSEPAAKMAIPAYFAPGPYWLQLENGTPGVGLAVMNPNSGPGSSAIQSYVDEVSVAQGRGILVLGYVYSGYGQRSANTVKNDISKYFQWYAVSGIFIDEASNQCSRASYYQDLFNYVKTLKSSATVVINPGGVTQECYVPTADVILNFEDVYSAYVTWRPIGWEKKYLPTRFWHLIHATSFSNMPNAVSLAKSRNAGWIYVTPDKLPNPWDTLPSEPYWGNELNLIGQ